MSEENVELTKRAYAAFATGGVEATLPYFAPDAVFHPFPEWPGDTEYRGWGRCRRRTWRLCAAPGRPV